MEGKTELMDEERGGVTYDKSDWVKHYRVISHLIEASGVDVRETEITSALLRRAVGDTEKQGGLRALLDKGATPIFNGRMAIPLNTCLPLPCIVSTGGLKSSHQ
jgi:hypothetical protein